MWASVVNRDGTVCAVARSGDKPGDQWPGSRVISAQKANTGNAFSLNSLSLSSGNLYGTVLPSDDHLNATGGAGGSLLGLQFSNPVDTRVAYRGNAREFGAQTTRCSVAESAALTCLAAGWRYTIGSKESSVVSA